MKPSEKQRTTTASDLLAADLASEMLSYIASRYANASTDEEKLDVILRYGPVMHTLQQTISRTARRQRRQRRTWETKDSR